MERFHSFPPPDRGGEAGLGAAPFLAFLEVVTLVTF